MCSVLRAATLVVALCLVAALGRVEADQTISRAVQANGITIDHLNRTG